MPCPKGLDIPGILHAVYLERMLQCPEAARNHYKWIANPDAHTTATDCNQCGECEAKCTQHLDIMAQMKLAAAAFDGTTRGTSKC
jgi:predicted aldo/keto reductase-like oxidoreductase